MSPKFQSGDVSPHSKPAERRFCRFNIMRRKSVKPFIDAVENLKYNPTMTTLMDRNLWSNNW